MSTLGLGGTLLTPPGMGDMSSRQMSPASPSLRTGCEHGLRRLAWLNGKWGELIILNQRTWILILSPPFLAGLIT